MKVTKITIGRLYNLGNYEHVRYELTAEVSSDESSKEAVLGLERILNWLRPLKCKTPVELKAMAAQIKAIKKLDEEGWDREFRYAEGGRERITERYENDFKAETVKREKSIARVAKARELFDDLGGASKWTDAKLEWEGEDEY